RAAESTTLRVWVTAALGSGHEKRALVLMGDLNDTVQAATTQLLLGPPGSEIGTPGFDKPDEGDHQRLWNLAALMPEGKNYSRITRGRRDLLDHILVPAALVRPPISITGGAVTPQPLPSITTTPTDRRNEPSSDHAPVVATFANL